MVVKLRNMIGTVHLLVGAMFGAVLPNNETVFVAAFFSHYILDWLPHIDPDTFTEKAKPYSWRQIAVLVTDTISTILFAIVFYLHKERWVPILLGGVAAQIPDLLIPLYRYPILAPLRIFHEMFHWNKERAQHWQWFWAGLATQVVIGGIALRIILLR